MTAVAPAFAGAVPDRVDPLTARPPTSAGSAEADHEPAAAMVSETAALKVPPERTADGVARVTEAGLTVTLTVCGALAPPPEAVSVTL